KHTLLSADALHASWAATEARLGGPGGWLLALPAWHIAGLQVLLRAATAGSPISVLDTAQPFTATTFTAVAGTLSADRRYVSLVPTQLHRILQDIPATGVLADFDAVLVGGATTSPDLVGRAESAGIRIVTTYGMSETCGGCVYGGHPLDGVGVDIDADNRIVLSGPVLASGYLGMPAHPAFPAPRTFVTDDLGTFSGGTLTVLGRADDVIVTGGLKVPPAPIEQALAGLPGIGELLVVGVPDPEWGRVVVAVVTGAVPSNGAVDAALADLPRHYRPRRFVTVDALPLRGPGKPDRRAAATLAEQTAG
ncbi:MAG: AMP-binding protein, partial [Actinomycetota bacterium]|nr:AMP-binding protein [Actinomycetota bacterium]